MCWIFSAFRITSHNVSNPLQKYNTALQCIATLQAPAVTFIQLLKCQYPLININT